MKISQTTKQLRLERTFSNLGFIQISPTVFKRPGAAPFIKNFNWNGNFVANYSVLWTLAKSRRVVRSKGEYFIINSEPPTPSKVKWAKSCVTFKWEHQLSGTIVNRINSKFLARWTLLVPLIWNCRIHWNSFRPLYCLEHGLKVKSNFIGVHNI